MPMIYVTVAGETFGIKTAKQEAMLHRMEKNYGPFMTADTVPAEKVLFIADIDRTPSRYRPGSRSRHSIML